MIPIFWQILLGVFSELDNDSNNRSKAVSSKYGSKPPYLTRYSFRPILGILGIFRVRQ